jgi:hypothetical protein
MLPVACFLRERHVVVGFAKHIERYMLRLERSLPSGFDGTNHRRLWDDSR